MIETLGLTKYFDSFLAVDHINLHVPAGEILVLLGPNGAGKTTTVRMLTSILRPSEGTARIAGFDVVTDAPKVRAMVGVLTEHHGLYGRMNAEEYLIFYGELYGLTKKESISRFEPLMEQFGMAEYTKKRLGEYSKGMRQKLALIRAMINNPSVLLLDEPTSAMDPESAIMVRNAIRELRSNERTIILCTHNLSEAEELADQIAIIQHGKIILNDYLNNIKRSLLGNPIYEVTFANRPNDWKTPIIDGVKIINQNEKSIQFEIKDPQKTNPILIQSLASDLPILSFFEIQKKLEDAYLEAINHNGDWGKLE
ncbi:MAG: ABC transporter ATP-binding protein [Anaerolineaceae bacterium]